MGPTGLVTKKGKMNKIAQELAHEPQGSAAPRAGVRPFYRPELDSLRFFAFFGVFLSHTFWYSVPSLVAHHVPFPIADALVAAAQHGSYGVDLFFALSAYLITELLLRERETTGHLSVSQFYVRRVLRIWPLYFMLVLVFWRFDPQGGLSVRYVLPMLLFAGNWAFFFFGWPPSAAVPLWSISVEEQFYLLWPPAVARLSRRGIILAAIGLVLCANIARALEYAWGTAADRLWCNTFAHLDAIAVGILIAAWLNGRSPTLSIAQRVALLALGFLPILIWDGTRSILDPITRGTVLFVRPWIMVCCAATLLAFIGSSVRSRPIQYLGKISYGLYAYHLACVAVVSKLIVRTHGGFAMAACWFVAAFLLTVAVSAVSYTLWEKPFLRLKQRFTVVVSRNA